MTSRQRHRHSRDARRCLTVEKLEDRELFAVAAFVINLYADEGGQPGSPIESDTVQAGESFFAEITAREFDPLVSGLQGVALDISWDPAALELADDSFDPQQLVTPALPLFVTGTLDAAAGQIANLGGSAFPASSVGHPIGDSGPERFALLHFRALQSPGESAIALDQGASAVATMPVTSLSSSQIRFERQSITIVPAEAPLTVAAEDQPPDDNGLIETPLTVLPDLTESEADSSCDLATYLSLQTVSIGPFLPDGDVEDDGLTSVSDAAANTNYAAAVDLLFVGPRNDEYHRPLLLRLEELIAAIAAEIDVHKRH